MPTLAEGVRSLAPREAFANADTIAVVLHGIGDPSSVEMIRETARGAEALWAGGASLNRISVQDLPLPKDVNRHSSLEQKLLSALDISLNGKKYVIVPVVWSGIRHRARRWTDIASGVTGLFRLPYALGDSFGVCLNLLRCVRRARGWWSLAVLSVDLFCVLIVMSICAYIPYCMKQLGTWLTGPSPHRYQFVLFLAGWILLGAAISFGASLFDLVGDVASYVAHEALRFQTIKAMSSLISVVAESAPRADILIVGHSLGSVLVSHAAAQLSTEYAGKGRTTVLTLGSPLNLMARVFPSHIRSPDSLLETYRSSGQVRCWINLWRSSDFIGRALRPRSPAGFEEASLGIGGHANYWSDERVWVAIAQVLGNHNSCSLSGIEDKWQSLPLSAREERNLFLLRGLSHLLNTSFWFLWVGAIFFQVKALSPWEKLLPISLHILVILAWSLGVVLLSTGACLLTMAPSCKSRRDLLHYVDFTTLIAIPLLLLASGDFLMLSAFCTG